MAKQHFIHKPLISALWYIRISMAQGGTNWFLCDLLEKVQRRGTWTSSPTESTKPKPTAWVDAASRMHPSVMLRLILIFHVGNNSHFYRDIFEWIYFRQNGRDELIRGQEVFWQFSAVVAIEVVFPIPKFWCAIVRIDSKKSTLVGNFPPHSQDLFLGVLTSTRASLFLWGRAGMLTSKSEDQRTRISVLSAIYKVVKNAPP